MDGGWESFVMLFAEVRHRKILFEKIFVVAPGVLRHGVGVVVSYGKV